MNVDIDIIFPNLNLRLNNTSKMYRFEISQEEYDDFKYDVTGQPNKWRIRNKYYLYVELPGLWCRFDDVYRDDKPLNGSFFSDSVAVEPAEFSVQYYEDESQRGGLILFKNKDVHGFMRRNFLMRVGGGGERGGGGTGLLVSFREYKYFKKMVIGRWNRWRVRNMHDVEIELPGIWIQKKQAEDDDDDYDREVVRKKQYERLRDADFVKQQRYQMQVAQDRHLKSMAIKNKTVMIFNKCHGSIISTRESSTTFPLPKGINFLNLIVLGFVGGLIWNRREYSYAQDFFLERFQQILGMPITKTFVYEFARSYKNKLLQYETKDYSKYSKQDIESMNDFFKYYRDHLNFLSYYPTDRVLEKSYIIPDSLSNNENGLFIVSEVGNFVKLDAFDSFYKDKKTFTLEMSLYYLCSMGFENVIVFDASCNVFESTNEMGQSFNLTNRRTIRSIRRSRNVVRKELSENEFNTMIVNAYSREKKENIEETYGKMSTLKTEYMLKFGIVESTFVKVLTPPRYEYLFLRPLLFNYALSKHQNQNANNEREDLIIFSQLEDVLHHFCNDYTDAKLYRIYKALGGEEKMNSLNGTKRVALIELISNTLLPEEP